MDTDSCVSFVFQEVSQMSARSNSLPCRFHFGQALAEALKTNTAVTSIRLSWNEMDGEGAQALCPGIPSGCSWCLCRQFVERFCRLLCSSFAFTGSEMFQILLTVSEVGEWLFELKIEVNLSFCVV